MAKQAESNVKHDKDPLDDEHLDISVSLIDDGLYLGNLPCARDHKTLEELGVTHVLTIDLVPLPRAILDRPNLTFKFLKLADVPKEDLISRLPEALEFIKGALQNGGTVLVHCFFGVSRSAAFVIAYIMEKYSLCYEEAYTLVQSKRHFVHPNIGFVAQLKLFGHMGYQINKDDPRFKQFRLKMAGQKLKQVKILPLEFADLIKPDPGITRERPDPIVYRCKTCRRVVASQCNIIPHIPKDVKVEMVKKGIRPPPSKLTGLTCAENGQILIQKLKNLACQVLETSQTTTSTNDVSESSRSSTDCNLDCEEGSSQMLDGYTEQNLVDGSIAARDAPDACRQMWFVEPMAWMARVASEPRGKLHCPKCNNKIGSFNWLMGCKCPCGQKVAPAFYLVPSKVEWSDIVQNVQVTI